MTTPPNDNDQFDADLKALETAMNTMMQSTFSMVFKQLFDSSNTIFDQFPQTTTIIDGNNVNSANLSIEEEFGGSDFKRLANKSKENRGVVTQQSSTQQPPQTNHNSEILDQVGIDAVKVAGSIFNLLFRPDAFGTTRPDASEIVARPLPREDQQPDRIPHVDNNNDNGGWSFSSTSQRTVYNPDGTQETIITKKINGVTEIVKQLHYPDGRLEETREQKNSFWNKIFGY